MKKIAIRQWLRDNRIKSNDPDLEKIMRAKFENKEFVRLVVATQAYTARVSTYARIGNTCYSHVVVEEK